MQIFIDGWNSRKKIPMRYLPLLILLFLAGCFQDTSYKNVGDIPLDPLQDDPNFMICSEKLIKQYYVRYSSDDPPRYRGEKRAMENTIREKYNFPETTGENGFLTIRFIVNCKGKSGRFRIEEMDANYQPKKFDSKISHQLLEITKALDGWTPRRRGTREYDFYQYLTFKIIHGQIIEILP